MIRPDCLLVWPNHLDYPVCRWTLERLKDNFNQILIGFSNHHVENQDLSNFVRSRMPFATFVDFERTGEDWRNDAVNALVEKVESDYILFLEQDFLIHDQTFCEKLFSQPHDFLYYLEGDRVHPAFALVKTDLVKKTHRDFSRHEGHDHFYEFFQELPQGENIETLGVEKKKDFYHLNGLSQNYMNFKYDDPFYAPVNFLYYNFRSLEFPNQHPGFLSVEQQIENKFGHAKHHTFLDNFFLPL